MTEAFTAVNITIMASLMPHFPKICELNNFILLRPPILIAEFFNEAILMAVVLIP
jgi:hypothetical protein